mmetsp:Transcript_46649/g.92830  ORF Transcript_46649/g.92830 Transcript_46649/m.92830 type:complete len:233 (-) Transcript_46649:294-992(-)
MPLSCMKVTKSVRLSNAVIGGPVQVLLSNSLQTVFTEFTDMRASSSSDNDSLSLNVLVPTVGMFPLSENVAVKAEMLFLCTSSTAGNMRQNVAGFESWRVVTGSAPAMIIPGTSQLMSYTVPMCAMPQQTASTQALSSIIAGVIQPNRLATEIPCQQSATLMTLSWWHVTSADQEQANVASASADPNSSQTCCSEKVCLRSRYAPSSTAAFILSSVLWGAAVTRTTGPLPST